MNRFPGVMALVLLAAATVPMAHGGVGIFDPPDFSTTDGEQIFRHICQGCHMADARGATGAGYYPALAGDKALASRQFMELTLINGRRNMPAFSTHHAIGYGSPPTTLSAPQIAAVVNYVRTHFGNHYSDLATAAEVAALDK